MFRSRLMREGSVGLFFLLGIILFGGIIFFLKDNNLGGKNYQLKLLESLRKPQNRANAIFPNGAALA